MIKRLLGLTSWYVVPYVVGAAIGFAVFPVWTRHFTVKEYGMMSVIDVTLMFVAPLAKFGLPKSALRFFSEFQTGKRSLPIESYYTTLFIGVLALSGIVVGVFYAVILILGPDRVGGKQLHELFTLAGVLIFLGAGVGVFNASLRAEQKAKFFAGMSVTSLAISLPLALILVFGFSLGVKGIYIGSICMQGSLLLFIFWFLRQQNKLVPSAFSFAFLIEAIRFGFPLVPAELANMISNIGDRYLLQIFLGSQAVGLYAVAYGLTLHLKSLLTLTMVAVMPMYLEIWEQHGREKTEKFLSSVLDYYLMLAIPAIILFSFFGDDIMILMASSKYEGARGLLPYLAAPLILHGAISIYTAGLYIHKRTSLVLYFTLGAGVLNVILNIVFIPLMGIVGAAVATLISYICLIALANIFSSKFITIQLNYGAIVKYVAASVMAAVFLRFIDIEIFLGIVLKLFIGILIYSAAMLMIDGRIREKVRMAFKM
ncbi:oligosaccharide flippase family protein [candidate division KSB1 bacterium]|nr:oligosaccharide flippase family protein [candidate division KSB1 bacterium]NIR71678.1 oligosaccharide flippase family protein [candidate division KSB1 bacterium]NIS26390.1 oligosaccharide flippase family protein [candidate division KSB1 bacterium]NIT73149.1 oligosaccharide flippase family protein [candidate division KSB1 bacterium]NIU27076.1 oligosaccharide flippase family protein [candidate division KSB1 bacterium]